MSDKYNRVPDFVKSLSEDELEELNTLLARKKGLGISDQLICSNTVPLYDGGMAADVSACARLIAKAADIPSLNYVKAEVFKPVYPVSEYEKLKQINDKYEAKWMYHNTSVITPENYDAINFLYTNAKMAQAEMTLDWLNNYNCLDISFIDEEHPDWDKGFNVHRRSSWLPSIELKIGLVYMIKLGKKDFIYKQMELVNIIWNNKNFPDLYFREYDPFFSDKHPMNISYTKVLNQINLKGDQSGNSK